MRVWNIEAVRIDGQIMAAVKIQDEWTGNITLHVRKIYLDGNTYYTNVCKERVIMTEARRELLEYEDRCKTALEWYRTTKF